ncbi:DUF4760 domain-containing protein [Ruegeria sp. ANG-R]|uniref:DUF4760 domain-containing protein n=1 Tax=Ruegeria sp. ANG-R TaxID=1577903 RepID=UPI00187C5DE6|nr:DUF4760 domain-containing protein [Ruegeria sp. ANG-R]
MAAILAALAVIVTTAFVWRQMRLQARGQDKDERRFLRESIHVIHETLQAIQFREARQRFFAGPHLSDYSNLESEERGLARYILSVYGLMARMIRHGAIDEEILRDYWRTALYRDWDRLENFVSGERLRAKNGNLFAATEQMVARWKTTDKET